MLKSESICKYFSTGKGLIKAVDNVSFSLAENEILGLVGESGSGKSTLGKILLRLITPTSGKVFFKDKMLFSLNRKELFAFRKNAQMVFQNHSSSLNPRQRVLDILKEPFIIHDLLERVKRNEAVEELLDMVKLPKSTLYSFPHELSGGQKQRVNIARAMALKPQLLILDEPLSALDPSIQSQIAKLLLQLREKHHLSYLFISHDLNMVKHLTDKTAVMYQGKIVEMEKTEELFANPRHPYTRSLFSSLSSF